MAGFIRMSPGFITTVTTYIMMNGQNVNTGAWNIAGRGLLCATAGAASSVSARLSIYKGAVPTSTDMLTMTYNTRLSDLLMTFDTWSYTSGTGINQFASASQDNVNPMVVSTSYSPALASGTASWFWWYVTPLASITAYNNAALAYNQIVGTVGVTGSGADLTMPVVALVAGSSYRILNYRLQIPTEWTF